MAQQSNVGMMMARRKKCPLEPSYLLGPGEGRTFPPNHFWKDGWGNVMAWRLYYNHEAQVEEEDRKYREKRDETLAQYTFTARQRLEKRKEELERVAGGSLVGGDEMLASLKVIMGTLPPAYEKKVTGEEVWAERSPMQIRFLDCLQPVIDAVRRGGGGGGGGGGQMTPEKAAEIEASRENRAVPKKQKPPLLPRSFLVLILLLFLSMYM